MLFYVRFLQLTLKPLCKEEDCFYVMLFIILAILRYQSSGCAHSFPPSNQVGFSVIYFLWTDFRKLTRKMPMVHESNDDLIFMK